jgi:hypothetical protein
MRAEMKVILRVFASVFLVSATMAEPPEKIKDLGISMTAATGKDGRRGAARSMEGKVINGFGKTQVDLVIDVFWFRLKPLGILQKDHFTATIDPKKEFKFESILEDKNKRTDNGKGNVKVEGWLVVVRDGTSHSLAAVQSSQSSFEALARTPGALDKLSEEE